MCTKEMLNYLDIIDNHLFSSTSKVFDEPLRVAINQLRSSINSLSPGSFVEKKKLFDIIDRIFDHYKSSVLAYTDILANYNEKCTVEMTDGYIETAKGLFMKIQDSVKSAISDYFKTL